MRCGEVLGAGLALWLTSAAAIADSRDPVAAEALFRSGRERVEAGDWATAQGMFLESNRLDFALGTLMNLAACEEHIGKLATAWERYRELLDSLPPGDDRREFVAESVNRLERLVPRLTVFFAHPVVEGAVITEDDVELRGASLGADLPVDPGEHSVAVTAPGHIARRYAVTLEAGQHLSVHAEAGDVVVEADAPRRELAPDGGAARRTAGVVLGVVGAGALSAGAILGVHALSQRSASDTMCTRGVCSDRAGLEMYDAAKAAAAGADIAFVIGAVSVGVAIYLFATAGPPRKMAPVATVTPSRLGFTW